MAKTHTFNLNPERWVAGQRERPVSGKKVRLTVDLAPDVHKKLKIKATMEEKTMQELVDQWIQEKLKD